MIKDLVLCILITPWMVHARNQSPQTIYSRIFGPPHIKYCTHTWFPPAVDGSTPGDHQLESQACLVHQQQEESWEDHLDLCVHAYNSAKHVFSKFSPFEVMSGRTAMLPVDLDGAKAGEDELLVMEDFNSEELERMMEERRARLEVVQTNILAAQERQKEEYDHKDSNPDVF